MPLTSSQQHAVRHAITALAARQAGHAAVWQCRMLGVTASWVGRQVDAGSWADVHRGVVRVAGHAPTPAGDLWAAMLVVADRTGPDRAADRVATGQVLEDALVGAVTDVVMVTGFSAAHHLGATDVVMAEVPELLVAAEVQVRRSDIRVVRTTWPMPTATSTAVPCAPWYRVLWDCAWLGRHHPTVLGVLRRIAVVLDRTRQLAVDELLALVDEPSAFDLPHRVPAALRELADLLRPGFSHSATEAIGREIAVTECARLGLVASPRPVALRHRGRIIAEADIAIEALRWDVEVDGPHHRHAAVRAHDRRRDARVTRLLDWTVSRYDHQLIDDAGATPFRAAFRTDLRAAVDRAEGRAA